MLLEKTTGLHDEHLGLQMYLTNLFAIPAVAVYVFALREIKAKIFSGNMNFKAGFISGCTITLIITFFSAPNQWIISEVITPEYFHNVIEYSLRTGYYTKREDAEAFFNLRNYMQQSVIGAAVMGIITSAITAFFLRSKN